MQCIINIKGKMWQTEKNKNIVDIKKGKNLIFVGISTLQC